MMSHKITPYANSKLMYIDMSDGMCMIKRDEPIYSPSSIVTYDLKNGASCEVKINKDVKLFTDFLVDITWRVKETDNFALTQTHSKHPLLCKRVHKSTFKEIPNPADWFTNLMEFSELNIFLSNIKGSQNLSVYSNEDAYQLSVWHDRAYVISREEEITSFHIDPDFNLQEGDNSTTVYTLNDNFIVYNDGDVYSVVILTDVV